MKTWDLYNVMKSSQGMRSQPLGLVATTAGFLLSGYPLYDYVITCKDILSGVKTDDSTFAALYMLDEGDDWKDESVWMKASPSLGQTVKLDYLREQVTAAINTPSLETGVRTKLFNQFCQSENIWLSDELISSVMQKVDFTSFEDHENFIQFGGVDLASVSDLTAYAQCLEYNDKYYIKIHYYLPESALEDSMNSEIYKMWHKQKYLTVTPGNVTDYDYIINDMHKIIENESQIGEIYYDQYNSTQWAINCTERGFNLVPFSQSLGNFNQYTKEFERLLKQGKIVLDYNPISRWCFQNAALKCDHNDNCKPVKGAGSNYKIDGVIAGIQALAACLTNNNYFQNIEVFN